MLYWWITGISPTWRISFPIYFYFSYSHNFSTYVPTIHMYLTTSLLIYTHKWYKPSFPFLIVLWMWSLYCFVAEDTDRDHEREPQDLRTSWILRRQMLSEQSLGSHRLDLDILVVLLSRESVYCIYVYIGKLCWINVNYKAIGIFWYFQILLFKLLKTPTIILFQGFPGSWVKLALHTSSSLLGLHKLESVIKHYIM